MSNTNKFLFSFSKFFWIITFDFLLLAENALVMMKRWFLIKEYPFARKAEIETSELTSKVAIFMIGLFDYYDYRKVWFRPPAGKKYVWWEAPEGL